jgi:C-5 cytosine-specific DNA methylase
LHSRRNYYSVPDENSTSVGTIKKRYISQQGDNPVLAHPTEEGKYRFFTLNEIKRLAGLPDSYELGEAKTVAGECIGQGVVVSTVAQILAVNCGFREGVSAPSEAAATELAVVIESPSQMGLFATLAA